MQGQRKQSPVKSQRKMPPLLSFLFENRYGNLVLNVLVTLFTISLVQQHNRATSLIETGTERVLYGSGIDLLASARHLTQSNSTNDELNDDQIGKTATVMAMATGYRLRDYQLFVGSLRKTGFEGNIILAVAPNIDTESKKYLRSKNVIIHKVKYTNCSHPVKKDTTRETATDGHEKELLTCVDPYPSLKHRWARFPLLRDHLLHCGGHENPEVQCGGPVLITDLRDTFFQRNPFGPEAPRVTGLELFAEHYTIRTTNWLVDWPVGDCKGIHYDEPMLCSGTTIGTRKAMLEYLEIFHKEMDVWMASPKCCCFETNGDDQSIHNYLYYSHMLDGVTGGAKVSKNRDGLVHTVGAHLSMIYNTHTEEKKKFRELLNDSSRPPEDAHNEPLDLSYDEPKDHTAKNWLGLHYGMTDHDGYFVDFDGSRSFIIHQYDRIGFHFNDWIQKNKEKLYYP